MNATQIVGLEPSLERGIWAIVMIASAGPSRRPICGPMSRDSFRTCQARAWNRWRWRPARRRGRVPHSQKRPEPAASLASEAGACGGACAGVLPGACIVEALNRPCTGMDILQSEQSPGPSHPGLHFGVTHWACTSWRQYPRYAEPSQSPCFFMPLFPR